MRPLTGWSQKFRNKTADRQWTVAILMEASFHPTL
jgi:hypothetical protein